MTIGELAAESGMPASTIRYWERIGVLPKPLRVSGQRRYAPDAVQRLAVLRLAQACGFHLDEMRHLLHGFGVGVKPPRRWQELPGLYRYLQIPDANLYPDVRRLLVETESHSPVLTERRMGAGRALFLGLNETWRWRLRSGEREADQFWRQLVRYAAGEPYAASSGPLSLDVDVHEDVPSGLENP